jgi:hypothetical protein
MDNASRSSMPPGPLEVCQGWLICSASWHLSWVLLLRSILSRLMPSPSRIRCKTGKYVSREVPGSCVLGPCAAVDFYNQVNLLYGTLTEYCTPEVCPTMSAGPK